MLAILKQSLWQQFGASIGMLKNAISQCPDDYWDANNKMFYMAYHAVLFLDYYLTIPPTGFISALPFTITDAENLPINAIDDLVPEKIYSKAELLDYVQASHDKCRHLIATLTEQKLNEKWIIEPDEIASGSVMNFSVLEILLFNMRHVQHHAAQLNLLSRQGTNTAPAWVSRSK